jgi:hypothetical protein
VLASRPDFTFIPLKVRRDKGGLVAAMYLYRFSYMCDRGLADFSLVCLETLEHTLILVGGAALANALLWLGQLVIAILKLSVSKM